MKVIDEKQRGVGMGWSGDDAGIADVRDHRVDGPPLHRRAGALDDEDVGIERRGGRAVPRRMPFESPARPPTLYGWRRPGG
jgi:hypothetical protein